jgi:hypothetical protein
MKLRRLVLVPVAALALLAGCTTPPGHGAGGPGMGGPGAGRGSGGGMGMHGPGTGAQGPGGGMGMGAAGDQAQSCAMYREMMAGKSPAEQQAAVEARMRSMHGEQATPERTRMYREMMEKNCAGASGTR